MKLVWVLGANGMLGNDICEVLNSSDFNAVAINRLESIGASGTSVGLNIQSVENSLSEIMKFHGAPEYILNAVGVVKPRISDSVTSIANAYKVNSLFPHILEKFSSQFGIQVLQIGTDCVFSGQLGNYDENCAHDAIDHYGLSKSMGEVQSATSKVIRSSIIGIEKKNKYSLVSWVENQEPNSKISGFINHNWNGVTTKAFANILKSVILNKINLTNLQHLVPANTINKKELVTLISRKIGREDLQVIPIAADLRIDRTLSTINPQVNRMLWEVSGYQDVPTIEQLVAETLH